MDELRRVLARHGIDTVSLCAVEEADEEIYVLTAPGAAAVPLWRRLRAMVDETGRWPIILGGDEDLEMLVEGFEDDDQSAAAILRAAERVDPEKWLADQRVDGDEGGDEDAEEWDEALEEYAAEAGAEVGGDEAAAEVDAADDFTIPCDILSGKPLARVHLALLPTPRGWESAAFLRFGGWNACPEPEVHVALWRRWNELYGAEPVGISRDVVEGTASRPPADEAAAATLAREQYLYCDDIVSQGVGSISRLATLLENRPTWYFWWD